MTKTQAYELVKAARTALATAFDVAVETNTPRTWADAWRAQGELSRVTGLYLRAS